MVEASERYAAEARRLVPTQVCMRIICQSPNHQRLMHFGAGGTAIVATGMTRALQNGVDDRTYVVAQDAEEVAEAFAQTHRKLELLLDARQ